MSKLLERLVALLPIPLLFACVAVAAAGWALKEVRGLPSYASLLTESWFQIVCFNTALAVIAFYGSQVILSQSRPRYFSDKERGVFVARLNGDTDGKAQLQTLESVRDALSSGATPSDVRVAALPALLTDASAAYDVLKKYRARVVLWG